jgi:tetratricopeptide (TPR) repeat protein
MRGGSDSLFPFFLLQLEQALAVCDGDEAQPFFLRAFGDDSEAIALFHCRRAGLLRKLTRFEEARRDVLKSLRISEQFKGRGEEYANGLLELASISHDEGKYKEALKHLAEAEPLTPPDSHDLSNLLNLKAIVLKDLKQFQEALIVRHQHVELNLKLHGLNHPDYATALSNAAVMYSQLNQFPKAIELMTQARDIWMKTLGPNHARTMGSVTLLNMYHQALTDVTIKKEIVQTLDRTCNHRGCNKVERAMDRCDLCKMHYLCSEHRGEIDNHEHLCPKYPDELYEEKGLEKIVKCRRCRTETKLMKCSVCEKVSYCGAKCQKEDWARHKLFCKKK